MLLTLRYELHLIVHAYRKDMDDEERPSFHESHLDFYYNKYFRKTLDFKNYGVANAAELTKIVKDVMEIESKSSILDAQVSDDTPLDNFVRLTEEHRRERTHRVDLGDESGKLNLVRPREPHRGYQQGGARGGGYQQSSGYGAKNSGYDNSRGGDNKSWGDSRGGGNSSGGYGKDYRGGASGGYNSRDQGSSYQSRDQGRDQGRDQRGGNDRDRGNDRYAPAAASARGGSGGYSRDDDRKRPYERDARDAGRDAGRDTRARTDTYSSGARGGDRGGGSSYGGSSGGRGGYDSRPQGGRR